MTRNNFTGVINVYPTIIYRSRYQLLIGILYLYTHRVSVIGIILLFNNNAPHIADLKYYICLLYGHIKNRQYPPCERCIILTSVIQSKNYLLFKFVLLLPNCTSLAALLTGGYRGRTYTDWRGPASLDTRRTIHQNPCFNLNRGFSVSFISRKFNILNDIDWKNFINHSLSISMK